MKKRKETREAHPGVRDEPTIGLDLRLIVKDLAEKVRAQSALADPLEIWRGEMSVIDCPSILCQTHTES